MPRYGPLFEKAGKSIGVRLLSVNELSNTKQVWELLGERLQFGDGIRIDRVCILLVDSREFVA